MKALSATDPAPPSASESASEPEPVPVPVPSLSPSPSPLRPPLLATLLFLLLSTLLFLALSRSPLPLFLAMADGAFGSGFALSETLVKATPILLCALATALPARLGLISVGAEGQLGAGAIAGTAFVLATGAHWDVLTLPLMLLAGAIGGAAFGAFAGGLRAYLRVNETISTLLLNYAVPHLVDYLVYGPWKDPGSLGWPATVSFPDPARLPAFFDTRLHLGLFIGLALLPVAHFVLERTRSGLALELLRTSPLLAARAGLRFGASTVVVMALGGALAGIAGIAEASAIEARLQPGVGAGAGYSGFLVAWLARGNLPLLAPLSLAVAALIAGGDNLQLFADLPSAVVQVLQGFLLVAALIATGRARAGRLGTNEVR